MCLKDLWDGKGEGGVWLSDIEAGEELFLNYLLMDIPSYIRKWCEERNLTDVGTLAASIDAQ